MRGRRTRIWSEPVVLRTDYELTIHTPGELGAMFCHIYEQMYGKCVPDPDNKFFGIVRATMDHYTEEEETCSQSRP